MYFALKTRVYSREREREVRVGVFKGKEGEEQQQLHNHIIGQFLKTRQ